MSRSDLARQLGLNRATLGYIVHDLLSEGFAREHPDAERSDGTTRSGRPGIVVDLDPNGAFFLGAEIGVDHITVSVVDLGGNEFKRQSMSYEIGNVSPDIGIHDVAELIDSVVSSLGGRKKKVRGVCVTAPGLVRDGVVVNALMLGWRDLPLQDLLQEALGKKFPVLVENDANALAIGVAYRAASEPSETLVCLNIENGVGGGIAIGGKLFRGAAGFAGEFGQLPLGGKGFCTGLHRPGHLESYIGKDAVLARYRSHGGTPTFDLPHFLLALKANDQTALRTAADWADRLAQGLTHVIHVINPGRVILGGSVAQIYPYVSKRIEDAIRKEFLEGFPLPAIELPREDAGGTAFGAACLLHQHMFSIDEQLVHSSGDDSVPTRSTNSRRTFLS